MGESVTYAAERQHRIYLDVCERGSVSVNELAEHFGVSKATIRTDLTTLENEGLLLRTHGGAIPRDESFPLPLTSRAQEDFLSERAFHAEKERIAEAAVGLVEDGDYLLVDNGTTALAFARRLAESEWSDITVYSNDLLVLEALENNPSISANVLPGKIRNGFHYAYGEATIASLQDAHFTKLFLTTSAMDIENGLTVVKPHLSNLKRAMIDASKAVVLITDSSKFGTTRFKKFANCDEVDVLITDSGMGAENLSALRSIVGRLIVVDSE